MKAVLIFQLLFFILAFIHAKDSNKGNNDINKEPNGLNQQKSSSFDLEKACEDKYSVSRKKAKISELEKKVQAAKEKDKQINKLKNELNKVKDDLKVTRDQNVESSRIKSESQQSLAEAEMLVSKLQDELDFYKNNFQLVIFDKINELYDQALLQAHLTQLSFANYYSNTLEKGSVGFLFRGLSSTYKAIGSGVSSFAANLIHPALDLIALYSGLASSQDKTSAISLAFNGVKSKGYEFYSDLRNSSISELQKNPNVAHIAEEIIDLALLALIFFMFLVVVNPIVSFVIKFWLKVVKNIVLGPLKLGNFIRKQISNKKKVE